MHYFFNGSLLLFQSANEAQKGPMVVIKMKMFFRFFLLCVIQVIRNCLVYHIKSYPRMHVDVACVVLSTHTHTYEK